MIVDEDSLVFRVEPADAPIELTSLAADGAPPCPIWLGPAHDPAPEHVSFHAGQPGLAVVDVAELLRATGKVQQEVPVGIYLAVVPERATAARVPDDVQQRLRDLGYVGGESPNDAKRADPAHP